jgi:hypothetical protein
VGGGCLWRLDREKPACDQQGHPPQAAPAWSVSVSCGS